MSKSKRRKMKRMSQPEQTEQQPVATVTPLKRESESATDAGSRSSLRYAEAKPHELQALAPLIADFFKEVNYEKAAKEPWPVINQMYKEMSQNPYSIVYACVDENIRPHGYCWF